LTDLLVLESPPIAVKFLKVGESAPEGFNPPNRKIRFCQAVMEASWGKSLVISPNDIACGPGPGAFGAPVKEKVLRGEVHYALGLYGSPEAAARSITANCRLPAGSVSNILVAPLDRFSIPVDTAILRLIPEQAMWICLTHSYQKGKRLIVEIPTEQCVCSSMAVTPYAKDEIGIGLGCYGSRTFTDISPEEIMIGIPGSMIAITVETLEKMKKPLEDSRTKKGFYEFYPEKKSNAVQS
jgi:uncharacterized protein (DUF169 family)